MGKKYLKIKRTPSFKAEFVEVRDHLRSSSPLAFKALPRAITTILDAIDRYPRCWPLRQKTIGAVRLEFHLAVVGIAYRRLHVRYFVDDEDISYLAAVWVDGQDEPRYRTT